MARTGLHLTLQARPGEQSTRGPWPAVWTAVELGRAVHPGEAAEGSEALRLVGSSWGGRTGAAG